MCLTLGLPPDAASSRLDAFAGSPLQVQPLLPTIIHAAGDDSTFKICPTQGGSAFFKDISHRMILHLRHMSPTGWSACSLEGGLKLPRE